MGPLDCWLRYQAEGKHCNAPQLWLHSLYSDIQAQAVFHQMASVENRPDSRQAIGLCSAVATLLHLRMRCIIRASYRYRLQETNSFEVVDVA